LAINWLPFNTNMTLYLSSYTAKDTESFVDFFITQLNLALLTATTPTGNIVLAPNLIKIAKPLSANLMAERITGYKDYNIKIKTLELIASYIGKGMVGTVLSPIPPIPPTLLPNPALIPCLITSPGDVVGLAFDLQRSLGTNQSIKTPAMSVNLMELALKKYFLTVGGVYNGLVYAGTTVVPFPPIPWVGLI